MIISFVDGEILHAETPPITFDLAVLEAEFRSVDPNAERALLSTGAIRQVLIGDPEPAPDGFESWDRAAFHFCDGEVLRAYIAPEAWLGRFGGVWRLVEPASRELSTVGIPYTSLKGVFRVRQWDSRPAGGRDDSNRLEHLARTLVERDAAEGAEPPRHPLLQRMRPDPGGRG